jgi:7-cyano-7-deazaguanine synthase in queuosine biosynthesis
MSLITNRLIVECGPVLDRRTLNIYLHPIRKRIGVLVSGGMDSALLYYLLVKLNVEQGFTHKITPYTIIREQGSIEYAQPIVDYVNNLFGIATSTIEIVGDNTLAENQQVESGCVDVLKKSNLIYLGLIEELEVHTIGWRPPIKWKESENRLYPFKDLNKSHLVDLIFQFKQEKLFELSHTCNLPGPRCGACNGCNERRWGFEQMGYADPGIS